MADIKNQLQELCQSNGIPLPSYNTIKIGGEPHNPIFQSTCHIGELYRFKSSNKDKDNLLTSKKLAEKNVAKIAYDSLVKNKELVNINPNIQVSKQNDTMTTSMPNKDYYTKKPRYNSIYEIDFKRNEVKLL